MIAEVTAAKAVIVALGLPVYFAEAPASAAFPRVILWTSAGAPAIESDITSSTTVIDDILGVTVAAETAEAVLVHAARVRTALTGNGVGSLTVTGRTVTLVLSESRPVLIDRDITIPTTNTHPAYGVDLIRLVSIPS